MNLVQKMDQSRRLMPLVPKMDLVQKMNLVQKVDLVQCTGPKNGLRSITIRNNIGRGLYNARPAC